MKLEHLLLGILLVKPRTGYDLARYLDMEGVFLRRRTQMSQVYRSLAKMAERGLITFTVSSRPGAHDAKIYVATPTGRAVFMEWLTAPFVPVVEARDYEFRARLFFSGFVGERALIDLLTAEIDALRRHIAKYRFRDRTIEVDPDAQFDTGLVSMVEDFQHDSSAAVMDAMVERLVELRGLVEKRLLEKEAEHADAVRA